MSNKKVYIPTDKEQRVAVNFLERLTVINWEGSKKDSTTFAEELNGLIDEMTEFYKIEADPFTSFPCTTKEYLKNRAEYHKQTMEERYGYFEG